jgi:hypothetical protein
MTRCLGGRCLGSAFRFGWEYGFVLYTPWFGMCLERVISGMCLGWSKVAKVLITGSRVDVDLTLV